MTAEQREKFKLYGCVPRCLAELAARTGRPIGWDEFCTRFDGHFSDPQNRYGLLKDDALSPILRALSLPDRFVDTTDYDAVRNAVNQGRRMALVLSRVDLNKGATGENNHCSVLHSISEDKFELWTPSQDGTEHLLRFPAAGWKSKACSAVIL